MEMAREEDISGWIRDPVEVMRRYVSTGSTRLAVVRILGSKAEARLTTLALEHMNQGSDPIGE